MFKVGINRRDVGCAIKYVSVSWCLGHDLIRYFRHDLHRSKEQKTATITVESNAPKGITKLIVIRKGSSKLQLSGRQHREFF